MARGQRGSGWQLRASDETKRWSSGVLDSKAVGRNDHRRWKTTSAPFTTTASRKSPP